MELATFDADTWDRITEQVHALVREPIHSTSVDLDIRIRELGPGKSRGSDD